MIWDTHLKVRLSLLTKHALPYLEGWEIQEYEIIMNIFAFFNRCHENEAKNRVMLCDHKEI